MTVKIISQRVDAEYEKYKSNVYSQRGEDGLIAYFMQRLGIGIGYFVEFGAWDGKHLSNCAHLAEQSWRGCFIEGDSKRYGDLVNNYQLNLKVKVVNRFIRPTGRDSLDAVLSEHGAPRNIEVLSIDIDGYDYAVWEHLKDFRPKLVIIEYNPTIPSDVIYVQDEYDDTCFGNSLTALWDLALRKGYRLVATTDWNAFFMPEADCEEAGVRSYLPWELKDTTYETRLFHGYNGQIKLAGNQTLVWHGVPISERALQVLPGSLQRIPVGQSEEFFKELGAFKEGLSKRDV